MTKTLADHLEGAFIVEDEEISEILGVANVFDTQGDERTVILAANVETKEVVAHNFDRIIDGYVSVWPTLELAKASLVDEDEDADPEADEAKSVAAA